MTKTTEWGWWASDNAEDYTVGPEPSRDAILAAARNEELGFIEEDGKPLLRFWIVEARKTDLRIADFCLAPDLMEAAFDRLADTDHCNEYGECNDAFSCTPEQETDLRTRLRAACEEWQQAHALTWHSWAFTETPNEEAVTVDLTEQEGSA